MDGHTRTCSVCVVACFQVVGYTLKEAKRDDAAGNAGDSSAADSGDACNVDNACSVAGAEHAAEPTAESAAQDGGESQS